MVNVTHDGNNRCSWQGLCNLRRHFGIGKCLNVIKSGNDCFVTQFLNHNHGCILVQWLIDGNHLTQLHELFDDLRRFDRHFVSQFSHRDGLWHMNLKHTDFSWCGLNMLFASTTIIASLTTGTTAPIRATACTSTGVTTGGECFFLGWIASPTAGQLRRFDLFTCRTSRWRGCGTGCARFGRCFCNGATGCWLVQSTLDGRFGWFWFFCNHHRLGGCRHHHANSGSLGFRLASTITQICGTRCFGFNQCFGVSRYFSHRSSFCICGLSHLLGGLLCSFGLRIHLGLCRRRRFFSLGINCRNNFITYTCRSFRRDGCAGCLWYSSKWRRCKFGFSHSFLRQISRLLFLLFAQTALL